MSLCLISQECQEVVHILKKIKKIPTETELCNMSATKPWLILINPASGTKLAGKMFKNIVKPGLDSKQVAYEVMETEYAGETHIICSTVGQDRYSVLTNSG